ncbi:prephenate dehydrogenase [Actinomadura algeriensis]|uniref:Prephenate dehydrogenase n=1 Tax=Actinomadura algeriensis TaxID=1679523 RepID=A0ABR9JJD1_9ACTN|nr:prephenate dehydrogenase [Actinomadura algeriensis]MBE1530663.1 prephenate dehydrogenase [Actinomadura algeriensis]
MRTGTARWTHGAGSEPGPAPRRVLIIGTGLIGTSIALALRDRGTRVLLADRDPAAARLAARLGAGTVAPAVPDEPADLAVLAVPPPAVPAALLDAQKSGAARAYTDVAGVKEVVLAEAAELGCDMAAFVGGHPLGGRERSGPLAARRSLFRGRPWVLCPTTESGADAVACVTGLAAACGAVPVTMDAAEHDRAVALISHAPHVVASAMAARFLPAPARTLSLTGRGARDVTRIAAGDPALWFGILRGNALPIADVIDDVARDLARTAAALRAAPGAGPGDGGAARAVIDLLARGEAGHGRIRVPGLDETNADVEEELDGSNAQ